MAKLELNALMNALHGTVGDLVLVREGENIYVRRRSESTPPRTQSQVAHNSRFALASRWARMILADPAVKADYQRRCRGHLTAHNLALSDFMHGPVIQSLGLDGYGGKPGDVIRVVATDDFRVVRVPVQIRTLDGEVLEQGEAERTETESDWLYHSQAAIPAATTVLIEVTALDLPGNQRTAKAFYHLP
jgi:hypothetical protein